MRILVTGGAGYIGSHTAKLLAAAGHEPVIFDDLSQGHEWAVKWGPFERGSLSDPARLAEVFAGRKMDAVVHFAANALVGESMTNPAKYFQNNTVGSLNLLNAMREAGVQTIVFSSTCATYGDPVRVPIDETHPQSPVNPYGESKLMVEKILRWYGDSYGLRWMALRYFNAAGASERFGEDHSPETHLIPVALEVAAGKRDFVEVFGEDYPTPDGTCVRDYIHVTDLARAHVLALDHLNDALSRDKIYNLGCGGTGYSVKQVLETVHQVTGKKISTRPASRRAGDPPVLIASSEKIKHELGWNPQYQDLGVIIETAWRWMQAHPDGYSK